VTFFMVVFNLMGLWLLTTPIPGAAVLPFIMTLIVWSFFVRYTAYTEEQKSTSDFQD
jgi:hypothetical protein